MTGLWLAVAVVGVATWTLKGAGPLAFASRPLPQRVAERVALLGPALLAALVASQAFATGRALTLDARAAGLLAAALALWLRAPLIAAIVAAALAAAVVRATG